ncbi:hypothetical protein GALL_433440 [mine drainage metagenome]|uniref:Uncharacterized protein n=1 Tax=mine drainage metagenome TaxID=410659 RepID=A0A1J5PVV7_9ZZZZ
MLRWLPGQLEDTLHNSLRVVAARTRAVCGVAFFANSYSYWLQKGTLHPIPIRTTTLSPELFKVSLTEEAF